MDPTVLVALITGLFSVCIVVLQLRTNKSIKTNHGKTIGQHVEDLGDDLRTLGQLFATHAQSDTEFQARVEPFLTAKE